MPDMLKKFTLNSQGITSDTWNLKFPIFSRLRVMVPVEAEQQKIGVYFRKLDTLISQHATQLTKLKQIKSACLEKMFV